MNKLAATAIVLSLLSLGAHAKEWTEIRLASEGAYPPFNTIGADGALGGFDIDIGNALCAEMKAKCTWVKQEWDGMIPALNARKFDAIIASMSITEDRLKQVAFSDKYYATPLGLVAKKGSPLMPTTEALKGKRVGVQRGTIADNFATKIWAPTGVDIVRYAKQDESCLDLTAGRLDAILADALEADGGFLVKPEGAGYAIARGQKVLDGPVPEIKRRHGGSHIIVAAERSAALDGVLGDRRLVTKADNYGNYAELELAAGTVPQQVLEALVRQGVSVTRFEIAEPTLHKIFIDTVGAYAAIAHGEEPRHA